MWVLLIIICHNGQCNIVARQYEFDDFCKMDARIVNERFENAIAICKKEYTI